MKIKVSKSLKNYRGFQISVQNYDMNSRKRENLQSILCVPKYYQTVKLEFTS